MTAIPTVLSIGDGIIDAVELAPDRIEYHPGGAALNLAVGLARLGLSSQLVTRFGADRHGFLIERHLREAGVEIFNAPNVDFTGVAFSRRINGEPVYEFNPVMFRRRIAFSDAVIAAMRAAAAVAVNSFPFDDASQTDILVAALGQAKGLTVVDPNPRPLLIANMASYREGAEKAMATAGLVKLSDEDIGLFYGDRKTAIERLFDLGVETLILTHGKEGASLHTRSGATLSVPIARTEKPVIDTMGAGDATLATVIAFIIREGMPQNAGSWRTCLEEAMQIAAATCAHPGGALQLRA
ncbi:PfkB family carbohydrate kinase [Taklimakanibacter lacteus]|uniref:PfkB family carbohydrate kinase n=1 Tax=Taklimakanibacter lacteus TaxID=2268456 RepID=UPI000E6680A1